MKKILFFFLRERYLRLVDKHKEEMRKENADPMKYWALRRKIDGVLTRLMAIKPDFQEVDYSD